MPTARTVVLATILPGLIGGAIVAAATSRSSKQGGSQAIANYVNGATVCGCGDVEALVQRLVMAQGAADFIDTEAATMIRQNKADDPMYKKVPGDQFGRNNYEILRDSIAAALSGNEMWSAKESQAETAATCDAKLVKSSTPCMDEIVLRHERDIHVPRCNADLKAGKTAPVGQRRAEMTIAAYANEERDSYASEVKTIRSILNSLPNLCRPSGWVGVINASESDSVTGFPPVTLSGTAKSRTENSTRESTRTVQILYRDTPTVANTDATISTTHTISETHEINCFAEGGGVVAKTVALTSVEKSVNTARKKGDPPFIAASNPSFEVDPDTGKFLLSFELPDVTMGLEYKKTDSWGSCDGKDDGPHTTEATMPYSFSKVLVMLPGTYSPKTADMINVSMPVPLPPRPADPTFRQAYDIIVRLLMFKVR